MDKEGRKVTHSRHYTSQKFPWVHRILYPSTIPLSTMSILANMGAKTMETEIENRFPEARDRRRIKRLVIGCTKTVRKSMFW